jgi:glutamine synthetase adenylyltransferase
MHADGFLPDDDWRTLRESYLFLRRVQLRHRLMSSVTHDELPQDPNELRKLAHYMGFAADETFAMTCHEHLRKTREVFDLYLGNS